MNLNNIPAGINLPNDIYVIIEIPANTTPIKYEVNKKFGTIFVDRFIPTAMFYPCNYGYINKTLSKDGDPVDVLVPTPYPLQTGVILRCRPIGLLRLEDEAGKDVKLISVPHNKLTNEYDAIKNIYDLPKSLRLKIKHFFKHYKDLEKNKWIKIKNWEDIESAKSEIISSFNRANKKKY